MNTILANFLRMRPEVPEYSSRNQHYLIAGANPTYYLDTNGVQEEQVAPMAASLDWLNIPGIIDGNIVQMIASIEGTYSVYFVTDTFHVYGANTSTIMDLGFPVGIGINNAGGRLACANGKLFATLPTQNVIYKMPLPSGVWTSFGGGLATSIHFIEPFLDYLATSNGSQVLKADISAFIVSAGIDIGAGWQITQMRNLNGKYLAIAAGQAQFGSFVAGYVQNYLFLWNGIDDRYQYSVKIPGKFIDMKVIDTVLYVAVQVANSKTVMYKLSGTSLKKIRTPQFGQISSAPSFIPAPIFDYKSYIGLNIQSTALISTPQMVFGTDEAGESEFVLSFGRPFEQFSIGYDGNLYGTVAGNSASTMWYFPEFGTQYQRLNYVSQWIPIQNATAIDIYYDTPPQGGNDAIHCTIIGKGEDIPSGTQTIVLNDITPATILNTTRTRLDLKGFTGDKIKVLITTTNTSWRPIIRQVVLIDDRIK